ncbi:hypothetical protein TraAM80_01437 [Trypanosoma rangeli]|uniref:Optic atrophy 3 protein (OPA3) n=1 Tax=Trypanosoma rangeli TaxID=5698 RepID=A0A3R7M7T3_TRYRA|nr:uncharacterized protein TraAM80_01437 [Trypanosoma rangeli]RNF10621.1 hypothetical protein TraAM80_01437 [Trypanosoma rangeli]|eukprot:RNF10621.1 hypothetical protein TraAM80_01437 [Trypanosoma rangeli]
MPPLPAFRFFFLAIRQLSKPVVKAIVSRAQRKATVTRAVCIGFGRFSLGISLVVEKWVAEDRSRGGDGSMAGLGRSAAKTCEDEKGLLVAPRSRSLLQTTTAPSGSSGKQRIGRLLLGRPMQSSWEAFRSAYSPSIEEGPLVKTGAEVLIELIVYSILAVALFFEISTASLAAEEKETCLLKRVEALEGKVNELIQDHHADAVKELEVPETVVVSHLDRLKKRIRSTLFCMF